MSDFNPRTHKECDTWFSSCPAASEKISIHALTKSATTVDITSSLLSCNFNPRTHKECDSITCFLPDAKLIISIHALTKSATSCTRPICHKSKHFNPRTHKECDGIPLHIKNGYYQFQSTHSQRVRLAFQLLF